MKKKQNGSKKVRFINSGVRNLIDSLEQNPFIGIPLKNGFYKIRLSIKSKGKGKSGGARVITCVKIVAQEVYLVSIYDKSGQTDITDNKLDKLFSELPVS